jgi:peptidoglycan/LPS O-acetylase OafA/YrhL
MMILLASRSVVQATAKVLLVLGAASYPIYVFHVPLGLIAAAFAGEKVNAHAPLSGVIFVLAITAFGFLLETKIDVPIRNRISRAVFQSKRVASR